MQLFNRLNNNVFERMFFNYAPNPAFHCSPRPSTLVWLKSKEELLASRSLLPSHTNFRVCGLPFQSGAWGREWKIKGERGLKIYNNLLWFPTVMKFRWNIKTITMFNMDKLSLIIQVTTKFILKIIEV